MIIFYRSGEKVAAMRIGLADYSIAKSADDDNDSIILRQLSFEISEITGSGSYKFMPEGRNVKPSDIAVLVRAMHRLLQYRGPFQDTGYHQLQEDMKCAVTPEAGEFAVLYRQLRSQGGAGWLRVLPQLPSSGMMY